MIDAELAKELKKLVAPEYQIPRRIFTKAEDGDTPNAMLELWGFDQQGAAA